MADIDSGPYTEEQRADEFRHAVMAELGKQTRAAEATRNYVTYPILGIGILAALFIGLTSMSGAGRKNDPPAATKATEGSSDGASAV